MSACPASSDFTALVEALKSPDNQVRDQAEAQLDALKASNVLTVITEFFNLLTTNVSASQKTFIAVILRKVIDNKAWESMNDGQKSEVMQYLLTLFQNVSEARVRHALCDVIVQVSSLQEEWPALYQFVVAACSADNEMRVDGLYLLGCLSETSESLVSEHIQEFANLISNSLSSNNLAFKVAASRTAMQFMSMELDDVITMFVTAIPLIISTIQEVLKAGDEDSLLDLLQDLDECIEITCSYLTNYLVQITDMCLCIAGENSFPVSCRSLASHIIATTASQNGGFFRKKGDYLKKYLEVAAQLISDIDDEADWETGVFGDEDELAENDSVPHVVGITMVSNIAEALRAAVYKPASQIISQCARNGDWKVRRISYVMLSHIAGGCRKQVETDLRSILALLQSGLNDPHPRVVYVALQAVAYVSVALEGVFQKRCGVDIIRGILELVQRQPCLRVQAIAASCVGQFCSTEMISKKIFKNTLGSLVQWLSSLCTVQQPSVQSESITTIGMLCRAAKDDFAPYFHDIIQGLLNILSGTATAETISVHISACTCLSSLVAAMGTASNTSEALQIMSFLMKLIEATPYGDERLNCLLDCASEIYQYCDRANQEQFLRTMIPYLLNMTQTDVGLTLKQVVSGPEYQNENGVESFTIDSKRNGKMQISISTTAIESVSNAIRLIHNLLLDAKEMMLPYVPDIHKAIKSLISFEFNEEVRDLSARIFPKLFELLVASSKEGKVDVPTCTAFFNDMVQSLIQQYEVEEEAQDRAAIADALRDAFGVCYESGVENHHIFTNQTVPIPAETVQPLLETLVRFLRESGDLLEKLYSAVDLEDRDMEDARAEFEDEAEDEKQCLECLLDGIGYVIRLNGDAIAPLLNSVILPLSQRYMQSNYEYIKFIGICMVDDIMLYATNTGATLVGPVTQFVSSSMHCEDPALRQAVLFGIKIIVQKYPEQIMPNASNMCNALLQVIHDKDAMEDDYHTATDNAVSALLTLLLCCRSSLSPKDFSSSVNTIADYLPLGEDTAEAQDVHERIVNELMKPNHGIFENRNVLDKVMRTLPLMLFPVYDEGDNEYQISYDDTKNTILKILKSLDNRSIQSLLSGLDQETGMAVMSMLK